MSRAAFDRLAADYDAAFTGTRIGTWLRGRVQARLDVHFAPGDAVLELGCGTGVDALHLARRGVHVTATDASPAMLDVARARLADQPYAQAALLDLRDLPADDFPGPYAGAFASFGPLNCLPEWGGLADWLAARIRPGGALLLGVMGPLCLWEVGWHALHGDPGTAFRRWRREAVFAPGDGAAPVALRYPSPGRLLREFQPYFRQVALHGLGVFLPPSDVYGVVERRSRLLRTLTVLETRLAHRRPFVYLGDHYWLELTRTTQPAP